MHAALPRLAAGALAYHVTRVEDWPWVSFWCRVHNDLQRAAWLSDWPVDQPRDWTRWINRPHTTSELEALRTSVQRGSPFEVVGWVRRIARRFEM